MEVYEIISSAVSLVFGLLLLLTGILFFGGVLVACIYDKKSKETEKNDGGSK